MPVTIRYPGGGLGVFGDVKIIYFTSKRHENIFFTFSVTEDIHGHWVQIFFSTSFEEKFIYFKIIPSPPPWISNGRPLRKCGKKFQIWLCLFFYNLN